MTEQKQTKLKYCTMYYTGKEISKKTDDYKIYKLLLKEDMDHQYPKKFSVFSNIGEKEGSKSMTLSQLEEGDLYTFGYEERPYTHPDYGQQVSKTIKFIREPQGDDSPGILPSTTVNSQQTTSNAVLPLILPSKDQMNQFISVYKEKTPMDRRNSSHFIGSMLRYHNKQSPVLKDMVNLYNMLCMTEEKVE